MFRATIFRLVTYFLLERPAAKRSFDELAEDLQSRLPALEQRCATTADTPANRDQLAHIIGIERWGQRRLQVGLGEPVLHDEYDGYRPGTDLSMDQLRAALVETRMETVCLARELGARAAEATGTVAHNQFGELSLRGWLRYLDTHANLESQRLK